MKTKYFVLAVLCSTMFGACQNNDPNKGGNEIINQLEDFVDGLGKIVDTQTLDDGSVVMKDNKGNTITKDKDNNVVIVSQQGDSTYIDNSIKEDESAPKDKWYHSTWKGRKYSVAELHSDWKRDAILWMQQLGFDFQTSFCDIDSTTIEKDSVEYINLHFNTTTCSWQNIDTLKEITRTGVYTFKKFHFTEQQVNGYKLKIIEKNAYLYAYLFYQNELVIQPIPIDKDSTISLYYNYKMTDKAETILETGVNTTFYNYRRLNDTQIAISNNSSLYLLKEENNSYRPRMEIYKDGKDQNISLELISL